MDRSLQGLDTFIPKFFGRVALPQKGQIFRKNIVRLEECFVEMEFGGLMPGQLCLPRH